MFSALRTVRLPTSASDRSASIVDSYGTIRDPVPAKAQSVLCIFDEDTNKLRTTELDETQPDLAYLLLMDKSEQLVAAYLRHCGYNDVLYEPDGNVPPDFLVDGSIAVEVRRLNQQYNDGTGPKGLEESAIPLWVRVRKLLLSLGPPTHGQSWFVFYRFTRPVPAWNVLHSALKPALVTFMTQAHPQALDCEIVRGFRLKLWPATTVHQTFFVPGGHSDEQSGGWLVDEIGANLNLCIAEKTQKVAAMRHKYPEWWLVLPDHIGWGLDEFDQESFRKQITIARTFDRVILLDPRDHTRAFRII